MLDRFRAQGGNVQEEFPRYYIRGAITQVDRGVARDRVSGGLAIPLASIGISADQVISIVSIDMSMGNTFAQEILSGVVTNNTIVVASKGFGADAEGVIRKGSAFLEVSRDRSEGTAQSVRTLIELGMIELIGKFTKVPYWRCLEIEATNPLVMQQAHDWYDNLEPDERVRVVERALSQSGLFAGPFIGVMTPELREAINQYKVERGLIANGRVDFDLYYRLLVENNPVAPESMQVALEKTFAPTVGQVDYNQPYDPSGTSGRPPGSAFVGLKMVGGENGTVTIGDELEIELSVERSAEVYCYYEFVENEKIIVARIFPNRWQLLLPDQLLRGQ